jgi:cytochrome c5
MQRACAGAALAIVLSTVGLAATRAQAQAPLHDSQYSDADIAYGATMYTSKCVTCHGTQGDGIGGVNLRSGTFRNAVIDRDLERFIRAGSPAGMPAFALDNADMAGIVASDGTLALSGTGTIPASGVTAAMRADRGETRLQWLDRCGTRSGRAGCLSVQCCPAGDCWVRRCLPFTRIHPWDPHPALNARHGSGRTFRPLECLAPVRAGGLRHWPWEGSSI